MKHVNIEGFDVIEATGTFAEAQAAVKAANAQAIGEHTDWVMPDTVTLLALQKLSPADAWVWSSSPYVGNSRYAWLVYFVNGLVSYNFLSNGNLARLVRASQLLEIGIAGHKSSIEAAGIVLAEEPAQHKENT